MVRTKNSTIRATQKSKSSRKKQLKNIKRCKKGVKATCAPSESGHVAVALAADVCASTCVQTSSSTSSFSSGDKLLGERTRTEFKRDSYESFALCDSVDKSVERQTKRGVVDFAEVGHLIDSLCCPQCQSKSLSLLTDSKKPQGLAVYAQVYCSTCEESVSERYLASKGDVKSKIFDINRQAVYASLVCGLGSSTFNNFCESLNLPGLHHKTFHGHANKMYTQLEELEDRVFSQTVSYVREVHAKHSGITLGEDDVLNISVSFDGTWLTRGHSSHIGVGCVVDLLTGLCLDAHVMCTYCQRCESTGKKLLRDKPDEYAQWLGQHLDKCDKNFTGNILILCYILFITNTMSYILCVVM